MIAAVWDKLKLMINYCQHNRYSVNFTFNSTCMYIVDISVVAILQDGFYWSLPNYHIHCVASFYNTTIVGTSSLELYIASDIRSKVVAIFIQGLVFISYPVIGLVDCIAGIFGKFGPHDYKAYIFYTSTAFALVLVIVGKGMFESTVIQFGTDQMIEASSNQLSTFTHWYYWSLFIGNICIDIIIAGILSYFSYCHVEIISYKYYKNIAIGICKGSYILSIPQCCLCIITLLLLYLKKFKNYLNIEPVGANPIKQIIDVLKYAYHHKYPVRRSALSYYQNTYPSRMDFGKVQYGGPFINEQVEDTKTVLRLLVLLASLFGFHLSSDGFSTANHILRKTCPSSLILLFFISNPSFISNVITLFGIPLFHHLRKFSFTKYLPNMKKRMWLGLLLLFLHELTLLIINNQIDSTLGCEFYDQETQKVVHSPAALCYSNLIKFPEFNTTDCVSYCLSSTFTSNSTLMWLLLSATNTSWVWIYVSISNSFGIHLCSSSF